MTSERPKNADAKQAAPSVDKSPERVRAMFGEIAGKYDLLNDLLSVGLAKRWRRRLVKTIFSTLRNAGYTAGRVETLDVATGTGDVIIEEHRQWKKSSTRKGVGTELFTTGADFVPQMLELAREKIAKKKLDEVATFVEADGLNLPFDSHSFDAVTISFGLRNMADPERGIAEMIRVCRIGGVVAILEFAPTKFPLFAPLFRFYFHHILPVIGQKVAKNSKDAYKYLPESVDAFEKNDVIIKYMRRHGLEHVRYHSMTFGVLGLFIGRKSSAFSEN